MALGRGSSTRLKTTKFAEAWDVDRALRPQRAAGQEVPALVLRRAAAPEGWGRQCKTRKGPHTPGRDGLSRRRADILFYKYSSFEASGGSLQVQSSRLRTYMQGPVGSLLHHVFRVDVCIIAGSSAADPKNPSINMQLIDGPTGDPNVESFGWLPGRILLAHNIWQCSLKVLRASPQKEPA